MVAIAWIGPCVSSGNFWIQVQQAVQISIGTPKFLGTTSQITASPRSTENELIKFLTNLTSWRWSTHQERPGAEATLAAKEATGDQGNAERTGCDLVYGHLPTRSHGPLTVPRTISLPEALFIDNNSYLGVPPEDGLAVNSTPHTKEA